MPIEFLWLASKGTTIYVMGHSPGRGFSAQDYDTCDWWQKKAAIYEALATTSVDKVVLLGPKDVQSQRND